jgi:hypothetical protein
MGQNWMGQNWMGQNWMGQDCMGQNCMGQDCMSLCCWPMSSFLLWGGFRSVPCQDWAGAAGLASVLGSCACDRLMLAR